jgi:hypothetical protein
MYSLNLLLEFNYGQAVYLVTDGEQLVRIVTAFTVRGNGLYIVYELSCGEKVSWHQATEISTEPKLLIN